MFFTTLASGSTGNAAVLSGGGTNILLDAGISTRRIVTGLAALDIQKEDIGAIVITHEHSDHIKGLRVLLKNTNANIYAPEKTATYIINKVDGAMGRVVPFECGCTFDIEGVTVSPFETPHDAESSCGYSFFCEDKKITCVTDFGHITDTVSEAILDSDLLMIESNHDENMVKTGPYPYFLKNRILGENGHISNDNCGKLVSLAVASGTREIILAHLSKENNLPSIAKRTVQEALLAKGAEADIDFFLSVAAPDMVGAPRVIS